VPEDDTELHRRRPAVVRQYVEQALASLDAAVASVSRDPEAALDDLLAARLLLLSALTAA
jgi:hypothetical protein